VEFIADSGLFLLKTLTFVIAAIIVIALATSAKRGGSDSGGDISITSLNEELDAHKAQLEEAVTDADTLKQQRKQAKKAEEKARKLAKKAAKGKNKKNADESEEGDAAGRVYVLDFDGDMQAKAAASGGNKLP